MAITRVEQIKTMDASHDDSAKTPKEFRLSPRTALKRFLYFGSDNLFFLPNKKLDPCGSLDFVDELAVLDPIRLVSIVATALSSHFLVRKDEALLVLAYCLRCVRKEEISARIYRSLPKMLHSSDELFLFVHYYKSMVPTEGTGFGHGLRTALKAWYLAKTPSELALVLSTQRGLYKWTHRDLISLSHLTFPDKDRKLLAESTFKKVLKIKKLYKPNKHLPGCSRLVAAASLKYSTCPIHASKLITKHKLPISLASLKLLGCAELWEKHASTISCKKLVEMLPMLCDQGILSHCENSPSKHILLALNWKAMTESALNPLHLLVALDKINQRETKLESDKGKNCNTIKIEGGVNVSSNVNPKFAKLLMVSLKLTMKTFTPIGGRYFLTIDLRDTNVSKRVYGAGKITCFELSVMLAIWLLNREQEVFVYTFTNVRGALKPVEITKDMDYEEALIYCKSIVQKRTFLNMVNPIKCAMAEKKKVDIFLTVVDLIPKVQEQVKSSERRLNMYKKLMSINYPKHIIMNLTCRDDDIPCVKHVRNTLQIAGMPVELPKIIDAFKRNNLS